MATIVILPKLGLTMYEGAVIKWLKQEGDPVKEGEGLVVVSTDKSAVEVEAKVTGILRKILVNEGSTVPILTDIAIIGTADEPLPETAQVAKTSVAPTPVASSFPSGSSQPIVAPAAQTSITGGRKIAPAARKAAAELGVKLEEITETKHPDRIESQDVIAHHERTKVKTTPLARKIADEKGIDLKTIAVDPGKRIGKEDVYRAASSATEVRIPVVGMRKVIAERLTFSKTTIPHMYLSVDVDMSETMRLRERLLPKVQSRYQVKLSLNAILIKVVAAALREHPVINSSFTEKEIISKQEVNVGLAVAVDNGLIVPVLKQADTRSIGQIAQEIGDLIDRAQKGKLIPDDYSGGTFTISNLGMYETDWVVPIINPPESAILGVGRIVKKPVVIDDAITIRPMMSLILSSDHRVIDGAAAAVFLRTIKRHLEEPLELLV